MYEYVWEGMHGDSRLFLKIWIWITRYKASKNNNWNYLGSLVLTYPVSIVGAMLIMSPPLWAWPAFISIIFYAKNEFSTSKKIIASLQFTILQTILMSFGAIKNAFQCTFSRDCDIPKEFYLDNDEVV